MAWPLFLVQTKAATPFHPPPLWELQFRGDRFLLGSAARHLSPCRIWRMHCDIRCVTATSSNRNLTLRRRANLRLPRRDRRSPSRRVISTGRTASGFSVAISAARAPAVGFQPRYFPSALAFAMPSRWAFQHRFALEAGDAPMRVNINRPVSVLVSPRFRMQRSARCFHEFGDSEQMPCRARAGRERLFDDRRRAM
jgi:hypothetical protein